MFFRKAGSQEIFKNEWKFTGSTLAESKTQHLRLHIEPSSLGVIAMVMILQTLKKRLSQRHCGHCSTRVFLGRRKIAV